MAGAYLEFYQQDSFTLTTNVALNNVAQELYQSTVWFTAAKDPGTETDNGVFINLNSAVNTSNIVFAVGGAAGINSIVNVLLGTDLTAALPLVNTGYWSLVCKTSQGKVYTLDRGRCAVILRPTSVSYA